MNVGGSNHTNHPTACSISNGKLMEGEMRADAAIFFPNRYNMARSILPQPDLRRRNPRFCFRCAEQDCGRPYALVWLRMIRSKALVW